ncbi:phosphate signaling complex protein PhoU [Defluviitalea phaphyphila]|uniref:phosphate signaling complex protein PhoU n=1 Tax=Defluviitalea phaphyphila TaxID=1473580 RepID=UPI0007313FD3|nr:phosphate signaling complex protein PhoU [Defluviitalea phaphyphila]
MSTRYEFEKELNKMHNDLLKMGVMIEQSISDTIKAMKNQDIELAKEVIKRDDKIDNMEISMETECIMIIARQQPIASDLRLITSILKIITDLERIADHCADISEYVIKLAKENYKKPLVHIPLMADKVKEMVKETIDSYIEKNIEKADKVIKEDDIVDQYFYDIIEEIQALMKKDSNFIMQGTYFIFIVKYLERMADHATNICEWIKYNITGNLKYK